MASITASVTGQTTANAQVIEMSTTVTYESVYITLRKGSNSSGTFIGTSANLVRPRGNSTSAIHYMTGLDPGTTYYLYWIITSSAGSTASGNTTFTTQSAPVVGSVGTVNVSNYAEGQVRVTWSYATNATEYAIEAFNPYGTRIANDVVTSNSVILTGLSPGVYYEIKVYGRRAGSSNGTPSYAYITTTSYQPGAISNVYLSSSTNISGQISMSWSSATNAQGYRWEIYRGNSTSSSNLVASGDTASTSASYSGLSEYTLYTVKVYAYRSGYSNGTAATNTVITTDLTGPVISSITGNGDGVVSFVWSASDAGVGMRSTSTYYVEISNANGTTYGNGEYTTNSYKSFISDRNGYSFVNNSYYNLRVTAYDANANTTSRTVQVQYKDVRPADWSWFTSKTSGSAVNITAQEWNSFCTRINQFRQYKNYSAYSFTQAVTGNAITATQGNQARSAILTMTPTTTLPAQVSSGGTLNASFFNGLRNSLNSIS